MKYNNSNSKCAKSNSTLSSVPFFIIISIIISMIISCSLASASTLTLLNQDPDPVIAGGTAEIRIAVENHGDLPEENTVIEFIPVYPVELLSSESAIQTIAQLDSFQHGDNMQIIKYKVKIDKDAQAGPAIFKIRTKYAGSGGGGEQEFTIDVKNSENAEIFQIDKTILIPGQENTLKFSINNVGDATLKNLKFSWSNADGIVLPVGSDNTKYIKYIEVGQSASLEYNVLADTNADAGLYKLDLILTYDDPINKTVKVLTTQAGIYVGGGTDFDIVYSESTGAQTSFSVANVGSNPASSVSIIIPDQPGWRVSGSNSVIIGNLDKGDYTAASFNVQSTSARPYVVSGATATGGNSGAANANGYARNGNSNNNDNNNQANGNQMSGGSGSGRFQNSSTSSLILMQVAYTDTMGIRNIINKSVKLNKDSNSSMSGTGAASFQGRRNAVVQQNIFQKYGWYFAIILVLVVLGFMYRSYRRKKMFDKNFKFLDLFRKKKSK